MREIPTATGAWSCEARFASFDGHESPVLRWHPNGTVRAQAVFFPPFGDEMNQTRRMYRLVAEALAARGIGACLFDVKGTGDSTADFGQASVSAWLDDCRRIVEPLARGPQPLILIGCRLGAALALQTSVDLERAAAVLVAWAPVWKGAQQLNALLRAARVARMARGQEAQPSVPGPKELWAIGQSAWLAGYPVSARLAAELQALDATRIPRVGRAALIELQALSTEEPPVPGQALSACAREWTRQGVATEAMALKAPAFWNVVDLVDVPELIQATVRVASSAAAVAQETTTQVQA